MGKALEGWAALWGSLQSGVVNVCSENKVNPQLVDVLGIWLDSLYY